MTLREIVDASLLAKSIPDEKTTNRNIEFLKAAAENMEQQGKQKMDAVIDGLKNVSLFAKTKKEEEERLKKEQKKPEQPVQQPQKPAQPTNTAQTAQMPATSQTAQQ